MTKTKNAKTYLTPSVKVVKFKVEDGFTSDTTKSINQVTTENDGMNERMIYDNTTNYGWRTGY